LDKFPTEEVVVAAVCSLIAYPLCEAGWHEIVAGGDITRGIVGLLFGVPIGSIGLSYHWWKGKIGLIGKAAIYWWPIAVVTSFIYVCGPIIYKRATASGLFTQTQVNEKIANATAPLRVERDEARKDRDGERNKLAEATKQLSILAAKKESPSPPDASTKSPVFGFDDAKRWFFVKQLVNSSQNIDRCQGIDTLSLDQSPDSKHTLAVYSEVYEIIANSGWLITQDNDRSMLPPGVTIFVPTNSGPIFLCAKKLKEFLDSLNLSPVSIHFNEVTPEMTSCRDKCFHVTWGHLETP